MGTLEEQISELKSAILESHKQIIKAVNICTADKHIVHVSRLCTRISLNHLQIIENRFIFKKTKETLRSGISKFPPGTQILVDILTKKGE